MLKSRLSALVGAATLAGAMVSPAMAQTNVSAYEVATYYVFNGNGGPGADLYETSAQQTKVGTKEEYCQITSYSAQGEPLLWCNETLSFTGKGTMTSIGQINQTQIEAGVPQTIPVVSASGIWGGMTGTQTITQTVYPVEYQLDIVLN